MIDTPTPRPRHGLTRRVLYPAIAAPVPRSRVHGYRQHCHADQICPEGIYLRGELRQWQIDLDDLAATIDAIAHDASAVVLLGIVRRTTVVESPGIPRDPR